MIESGLQAGCAEGEAYVQEIFSKQGFYEDDGGKRDQYVWGQRGRGSVYVADV